MTATLQSKRTGPECWAHRGASAEYPENTLAAFAGAIAEGSDCIESDLHTTTDNQILLFHDVSLERTTDGHGFIKELPWAGPSGIEHVRTKATPIQPIPLFQELLKLLMEPQNRHIRFNIDVKPTNEPEQLFTLMAEQIRKFPNWETDLAPRLILGLWHPSFLLPARRLLPSLTLHNITPSLSVSLSYFAPHVSGYSVAFPLLLSPAGQAFLNKAREEGKEVGVWTVNDEAEMCVAASWGIDWILTDRPGVWRRLRGELAADFEGTYQKHVGSLFAWSSFKYYSISHAYWNRVVRGRLLKAAGPFIEVPVSAPAEIKAKPTGADTPVDATPGGL